MGHYRHLIMARCGPTHFRKISSCIGNTLVRAIRSGFTVFEREIPLCLPGAVLQSAACSMLAPKMNRYHSAPRSAEEASQAAKSMWGVSPNPDDARTPRPRAPRRLARRAQDCRTTLSADPRTEYSDRECTRDFGGAALAPQSESERRGRLEAPDQLPRLVGEVGPPLADRVKPEFLFQLRPTQRPPQHFKTLLQPAWRLGTPEHFAGAGCHQRGNFG